MVVLVGMSLLIAYTAYVRSVFVARTAVAKDGSLARGLAGRAENSLHNRDFATNKELRVMRSKMFFWLIGPCVLVLLVLGIQYGCKPASAPQNPSLDGAGSGTSHPVGPISGPKGEQPGKPPLATGEAEMEKTGVPLGLPPVPVPEDNPQTPEKIALGKMLYFDKRLSKDGTISCATCHDPEMAWTEHRATSKGIKDQVGGANSPTVINAAYATAQFWDGRAASLEEQALGPMANPIEMGHNLDELVKELAEVPEYKEGFQKVFGTAVTKDGMAKAIASFERTILSGNSPYDQFKAGKEDALNESQKHGMELFEDLGCATCHAPPLFSNYRYYNAGIGMDKDPPDEGRKAVTGKDGDLGKFRVPALREVANTHPYYHDGSIAKLEDAVAMMAAGGKDNPNLSSMFKGLRDKKTSEQDQKDIVEFLKSLSGEFPGR